MNDPFTDAAPETPENPHSWFDEPVYYDGMLVTRSTAFKLCADEFHDWGRMQRINDLPRAAVSPGKSVLSAAAAYQMAATPAYYADPGRDF